MKESTSQSNSFLPVPCIFFFISACFKNIQNHFSKRFLFYICIFSCTLAQNILFYPYHFISRIGFFFVSALFFDFYFHDTEIQKICIMDETFVLHELYVWQEVNVACVSVRMVSMRLL